MKALFSILLSAVLLIVSSVQIFAADVVINGGIFDPKGNPIPGSTIVFIDSSGKTISAAKSEIAGIYSATVPSGTYTIAVSGPEGLNITPIENREQAISENMVMDFTLSTPIIPSKETMAGINFLPYILAGGLMIILLALAFIVLKKKKKKSSNKE